MQKLGGAVIHMQQSFSGLKVLFSKAESFEEMKALPSRKVFDEEITNFLNELSVAIRKDREAKTYPDVVTFGFFCRKANIELLKETYSSNNRIGRGISFHIAPSNVPINFAYTLVAGLLSGNSCIVRTSTKDFKQTEILCRLMEDVVQKTNSIIGKYIAVIQYGRNKEINDFLSEISDVRVIWGGDATIREIRKSEIPSRCVEVTFADRYSICVLEAKYVKQITDWSTVAQNFYNDTYLYDQNACSSPRLMYWIGEEKDIVEAKKLFWNAIYENISPKYVVEPVIAVDKLMMDYRMAIELENISIMQDESNLFHRINVTELDTNLPLYSCPGGSYIEYDSDSINDLEKIVTKKYQTLSYLVEDASGIADWVKEKGLPGIDRIVPMGKTADFTMIWDGYNLIETMSRVIHYV